MSTCGSGTREEDYNLSLHVGALFIILGVSAGACALPIIALRVPQLRIPAKAHFGFRHFGTGVLIATAFVHLIPTAFISLIDPCLPPFFNEQYPALAGAIALAAVFMITIAEMVFSPGRSLCSGPPTNSTEEVGKVNTLPNVRSEVTRNNSLSPDEITPAQNTPQFGRTRSGRSHSVMKTFDRRSSLPYADKLQLTGTAPSDPSGLSSDERRPSDDSLTIFEEKEAEQQRKKLLMQCLLLECGILFHSIFIGLALAVAVGSEQVILLIAIAFHQTFEGLALGSRIAAVGWKPKAIQPWLMALAYGCTTPLGQAIGIATRNLYDPDSATGLVVVGTFNAFSAGLLTYTSLVDLLSEDFLSDHSWKTLRGNKRVVAMSLVFFGAFCMSLIGAWA
ncbi:Putative zinc/iron permease [Septoria linicola]|uniref:Zinc/iron permease n=1 Tax=Septoria linicola TaxID=215465 RepID=A0A9Q9AL49_9PEZI|nr:Putative zinc/iron permease [Septoria linicola]